MFIRGYFAFHSSSQDKNKSIQHTRRAPAQTLRKLVLNSRGASVSSPTERLELAASIFIKHGETLNPTLIIDWIQFCKEATLQLDPDSTNPKFQRAFVILDTGLDKLTHSIAALSYHAYLANQNGLFEKAIEKLECSFALSEDLNQPIKAPQVLAYSNCLKKLPNNELIYLEALIKAFELADQKTFAKDGTTLLKSIIAKKIIEETLYQLGKQQSKDNQSFYLTTLENLLPELLKSPAYTNLKGQIRSLGFYFSRKYERVINQLPEQMQAQISDQLFSILRKQAPLRRTSK